MGQTRTPWAPADAGPSVLEPFVSAGALLALIGLTAWRLKRR